MGLSGLGAEICKNIVLCGVKSLTLLDSEKVTEEDFTAQFLIPRTDLGKNVRLSRRSWLTTYPSNEHLDY